MRYLILEVSPGDNFENVAKKAKRMAIQGNQHYQFEFNEVTCRVDENTNLEWLLRDYFNAFTMEWKTIGPDCLAEYPSDVQADLEKRKEQTRIRREKEEAEYAAKQESERQAFKRKTAGIEMEISNPELWQKGKDNNQDAYGSCVYDYAEGWAKLMQLEMAQGKTVANCAERTSFELGFLGISGFMYGCAVGILSQCWKHGEALRKWHNKEYGHEGDGVVNPAIMTIGSND